MTADQTLHIFVGGEQHTGGGFSGGGERAGNCNGINIFTTGVGATDIRTLSGNLTTRFIVAGGGDGGASGGFVGGGGGTEMSLCLCVSAPLFRPNISFVIH